ncbi:MAG: non-ribosomal peptide synthetase, partial [Cyanobacteriota bacterium]
MADHTTLEVLFEEIAAHQAGRFDTLPPPLPYRNYIAQARLGQTKEAHTAFFQELLGEVDEPTAPFGHLEVRGDGTGIEESRHRLDPDLATRLRLQARRLGVTPASLFHLVFARVLAAISGRSEVVFGTVLFGRLKGGEGADRMPGLFINTLPVRIQAGEEGVEAAVQRTHRTLAGLLRHEHAPLALAQRCSGVEAPTPLFSALFNYRHSPEQNEGAAMAIGEGIKLLQAEERTNYPLAVSVDDLGEGFSLTAQSLPEIGAERLCGYLETATESLVAALETAPATRVRGLAVLPQAERQQVLENWNATEADYPHDRCVHQLFEEQVERTPQAVALVFDGQSLTYSELNARANRLAHLLISLGIGPDDRVAIAVERSLEMVVGLLAILKAGGAYVPLDPAYPEDRLLFMLQDSAPVVLLVHGATRDRFASLAGTLTTVDLHADAPFWTEWSTANPDPATLGLTGNQLAYVIYTSGSTGEPKGVQIEHDNLLHYAQAASRLFGVNKADRFLQFASICFDLSVEEIFPTLLQGATLVLRSKSCINSSADFLAFCREQRLTVLDLPTAFWHSLLVDPDLLRREWPSSVRLVVIGGEAVAVESVRCWLALFGDAPLLLNTYGPTEITVTATCCPLTPDNVDRVPIGKPLENVRAYVVDVDGQSQPIGVPGELVVAGAGVARGYLGRPELTAEKFIELDVLDRRERVYKTGDLVRWLPDGNLEFLGRVDSQVKIRGFRIELGEIEAALMSCDGIREALVLAREEGPGEKRLVAYVTTDAAAESADRATGSADAAPLPAVLKAHLQSRLPAYMVPAAFVTLHSLPLTPNGKLDRKALPAPEAEAYATGAYVPPEGPVEESLAAIWRELLGSKRVGRH